MKSTIAYTQSRLQGMHAICDQQERYFFAWPSGWTAEQVAADFLAGFRVDLEPDEALQPVKGWIEDPDGNHIHSFSGMPGDVCRTGA